ncbi:hypothetical protein PENANT_c042G03974 [Penicillium antarcticum]|uniref:Uncharacterized protein n=1 Tax=Penicillium antarcticum TaxID=416450 RepID=A0A1V6PT67_9EURO|nr:hypothetical protein PENANT_c042G03974 [Penicillium antarcticum]
MAMKASESSTSPFSAVVEIKAEASSNLIECYPTGFKFDINYRKPYVGDGMADGEFSELRENKQIADDTVGLDRDLDLEYWMNLISY